MLDEQRGPAQPVELDLSEANCTEFLLETEFAATEDIRQRTSFLFESAEAATGQAAGTRSILYGGKYGLTDRSVGIAARLEQTEGDQEQGFSVRCRFFQASDDLPEPPGHFRPISDLIQLMSDLAGTVSVDCDATFNYLYKDGFQSRITLPAPLLMADLNSPVGLTHIESVALSQREAGNQTHSVVVYPITDENGEYSGIAHDVDFSSTSTFTADNIRQIFEVARRLSRSLIHHPQEQSQ